MVQNIPVFILQVFYIKKNFLLAKTTFVDILPIRALFSLYFSPNYKLISRIQLGECRVRAVGTTQNAYVWISAQNYIPLLYTTTKRRPHQYITCTGYSPPFLPIVRTPYPQIDTHSNLGCIYIRTHSCNHRCGAILNRKMT